VTQPVQFDIREIGLDRLDRAVSDLLNVPLHPVRW